MSNNQGNCFMFTITQFSPIPPVLFESCQQAVFSATDATAWILLPRESIARFFKLLARKNLNG